MGVGAFQANFYGNEVIPCQDDNTFRQVVECARTMPLEVFRQQNYVADFCSWSKFLQKND